MKLLLIAIVLCFAMNLTAEAIPPSGQEIIRVAVAHNVRGNAGRHSSYRGSDIRFNGKTYSGELKFVKDGPGTVTAINILPLEEYLSGLVASEMPKDWPIEAIKAQSVAARTYALFQKKPSAEYDVESSVLDQVYNGKISGNERVKNAVKDTEGEVLKKDGRLVKTFFNSTCGGQTETALNVWGDKNLFTSIADPYCARSPYSSWTYSMETSRLVAKLKTAGFQLDRIKNIQVETNPDNPRAATVVIETGGQTLFLRASDFRKMVGFQELKSTWFTAEMRGNSILLSGHGFGHGVGMCQWGAKGMAETGKSYREILGFYYPGTEIQTWVSR